MMKDKMMYQKRLVLGLVVVFLLTLNGVGLATPYVEGLSLIAQADSGGLQCVYELTQDPASTSGLTAATAWYKDGVPLTILYLPFEGGETKSLFDYSTRDSFSVSTSGDPTWLYNGGHDGSGAYEFDGSDHLDAGDIFPTSSSYTKTAWIYRTGTSYNNIISGDILDGENNHTFKVDNNGILNAGHAWGSRNVFDPDPIDPNTWYFVAVTFDHDTGLMTLYTNGEFVDSTPLLADYWDVEDASVLIGACNNSFRWQGKIDDARIYDYALSSQQIRFMYEYRQNVIAQDEMGDEGQQWQADVTPFTSTEAGAPVISSVFTVGDDDSDGVLNSDDNCPGTPAGEAVNESGCSLSQLDSDGDGVSDAEDLCPGFDDTVDVDHDGIPDGCDDCIDTDEDTVCDNVDNCIGTYNPEQEDADNDGIGDACDDCIDTDEDGVCDENDNCPDTPNQNQEDLDGDGIGDVCDDDVDGDGVLNEADNCPNTPLEEEADEYGCSASQRDTDNDGVTDDLDLCPGFDDNTDVDHDGIPDGCDDDNDNDGVPDDEELGPDGEPGYDGNGDGTADSLQANVVSGYTYDDGYYVTLAVTDPAGATLTDADVLEPPAELPDETEFPYGVFAFTIENVVPGASAIVKLYLPDGESPNTYYKFGRTQDDQTDHWYEFMYDGTTGAEINDNVITLHFVDGARGDDDLTVNGTIMDDGAPAISDTAGEEEPDEPVAGGGGGGGGCFISTGTTGSHAAMQVVFMLLLVTVLVPLVRFEMKRENK